MHPAIERIPPPYPDEATFLLAFRSGDREAFRFLDQQYHATLANYIDSFCVNPVEAQDIYATAFLKLFQVREKLKSHQHIRRWLFVVIRNATMDYLRNKKQETLTLYDLRYLTPRGEFPDDTRHHILKMINAGVSRLPPQQKTIICQYFYEQKTTFEIARYMQLSPQTILNHKTKALDTLRKKIVPAFL